MLCHALHWGMDTNTLPLAMAQYPSFGGKRALTDESQHPALARPMVWVSCLFNFIGPVQGLIQHADV